MTIHKILTNTAASITDLKRNPMGTVIKGTEHSGAMAILNRNEPAFYCLTPDVFEKLCDILEDIEFNKIADERLANPNLVEVSINEL